MPTLNDFKGLHQHLDAVIGMYERRGAPHALLFHGPDGVGKRTLARLVCMSVLCQSPDTPPCGVCRGCVKAAGGKHANLITLFPEERESSIKIDRVRSVLEQLNLNALEQGARVVLIEQADKLTPQAQNALLKSLEEPQPGLHFVLTSLSERAILPTILSRCMRAFVPPRRESDIVRILIARGLPRKEAEACAALSAGSIGRALTQSGDTRFAELVSLADSTFFSVREAADIPKASSALKNAKDDADKLLDILEERVSRLAAEKAKEGVSLSRMLSAISEARRYRQANVSWQAIADQLLFYSLEELSQCQ